MLKFIARNDRWLFLVVGTCVMLLHIINADKSYFLMHLANTIGTIGFLFLALAKIREKNPPKNSVFFTVLAFFSLLEIAGIVALLFNPQMLAGSPFFAIVASAIPPLLNISFLVLLDFHENKQAAPIE